MVEQGDILKIEGIKNCVLVVSKNVINESGCVIVCPIVSMSSATLSYPIGSDRYVICDNLRQLDLEARSYSHEGSVPLSHIIGIIDRVQSMFDYY